MTAKDTAPRHIKIDFVSDVSCPWCVIGLKSLEAALVNTSDVVNAEIHFQPFELNPLMPLEGQEIVEHLSEKYGINEQQIAVNRENIRLRGEALGFTFAKPSDPGGGRSRIYNTFDAHRLLHWAEVEDGIAKQKTLKEALFTAYFTQGQNPGSHEVLARVAGEAGLNVARAREVLASNEYEKQVRERQQFYTQQGIHAVPAVIINDKHLISGGQPIEVFEQAFRQIAELA